MIDTIIDSFDIWTDAQGVKSRGRIKSIDNIKLVGIQKLRELILNLAISGKLVDHINGDDALKELNDKISLEKESILKLSGSKKTLKSIKENELVFSFPKYWKIERLGNIAIVERGGSPRPIKSYITQSADGLNWIKIGDTQKGGKYITSTNEKIIKKGLNKTRQVYPGDFLLTNSMSYGRPYITKIEGCIHDGWLRISPPQVLNPDYLYHLLSSNYVKLFFDKEASGAVVQNLNADKVRKLPIPIPPLEEQKRIVAKVDELMALCGQLEQERETNLKTHQILVKTILESLTQAKDADEFQVAWERMSTYFDTLFYTEDSVDQLKETILQLGVMGKLVKQDPNDESSQVLLKKVALFNEDLIKKGKIRKKKPILELTNIDKSFNIADGWSWIRLASIAEVRGGKRLPKGHSFSISETNHIYIQVTNMKNCTIVNDDLKFISKETQEIISKYIIKKEDLYITIAGTIGEVGVVPDIFDGQNLTENAARIIFPNQYINKSWLQKTLNSKYIQLQFEDKTRQVAQPKLALHRILSSCIAIPPLEEQKRISDKIDNLFAICDTLSQRIIESKKLKNLLSETIIKKVI